MGSKKNNNDSKRGKNMTSAELEYIRQHSVSQSDAEIAKVLNRKTETIAKYRKRMGIVKGGGGKIKEIGVPNTEKGPQVEKLFGKKLDENDKKEFFKTKLINSLYYDNIKKQFSKEEIDYYLEEWSALCLQFQDVVATESRQIDELIKASIMGNRLLRNIKFLEEQIEETQAYVKKIRLVVDIENNIEAQERDRELLDLMQQMRAESKNMTNDYHKIVSLKNQLLGQLNARRKDRIDQIKRSGNTFLSMVEAFQDTQVREVQGRYAELVKLAKENQKNKWRKVHSFPDGSRDNLILDQHSILEDIEYENDEKGDLDEDSISGEETGSTGDDTSGQDPDGDS